MKKVIITILIFLAIGTSAGAVYYDEALTQVWQSRKDLQKAFPGDPNQNQKFIDWAKKYGWKEDARLIAYSPFYDIFSSIIKSEVSTLNNRIETLQNQINELKIQPTQQVQSTPVYNTTTQVIEKVDLEQYGQWQKVCINNHINTWNLVPDNYDCFNIGSRITDVDNDKYSAFIFMKDLEWNPNASPKKGYDPKTKTILK